MTAKEAYLIFKSKFKDKPLHHAVEYETCFVFVSGNPKAITNDAFAVNKQTGKLYHFNPMKMPIEEFKNGKLVSEIK